jgi:hypothetical protein
MNGASKLSPVVPDSTVVLATMASGKPVCAISTVPLAAANAPGKDRASIAMLSSPSSVAVVVATIVPDELRQLMV